MYLVLKVQVLTGYWLPTVDVLLLRKAAGLPMMP